MERQERDGRPVDGWAHCRPLACWCRRVACFLILINVLIVFFLGTLTTPLELITLLNLDLLWHTVLLNSPAHPLRRSLSPRAPLMCCYCRSHQTPCLRTL